MRAATTIALIFVISVVVVTVCNQIPAPEPQRAAATERSMTTQPEPVLPANARHVADVVDAVTAHEANKARGGKVFDGKRIVVYGRVVKIEGQADRGFVLFLRDVRDGQFSLMLSCHFPGTSKDELGKLVIGQSVLLRGNDWYPSQVWNTIEGGGDLITVQELRALEAP